MTQQEIENKFKELGYTKTKHTKDVIIYDDLSIDGTPSHYIKPYTEGEDYRNCINHDKYIEINKVNQDIYCGEDVGELSKELENLIQQQVDVFFNQGDA